MDTDLGGPINPSSQIRLYLSGTRAAYVRGTSAAVYTGRRWESGNTASGVYNNPIGTHGARLYDLSGLQGLRIDNSNGFNATESAVAFYQIPIMLDLMQAGVFDGYGGLPESIISDTRSVLYRRAQATIYHWNMSTRTVFLPSGFVNFRRSEDARRDNPFSLHSNGDMTAEQAIGKDSTYSFDFYLGNLTSTQWDDLLSSSHVGLSGELYSYYINNNFYTPEYSSEIINALGFFAEEARNARSTYLQLPPSLPNRVGDLAQEIAKDELTDYGVARAIERYLSESFPYTTDTPETPRGEDFVDYFLFELQEGYCVYYATAMTVMCRAMGLPARYVEGFAITNNRIDDFYYATGEQAHAWTEVYLDGFGWVQFEPTAGFTRSFYGTYRTYRDPTSPSADPEDPWESEQPYSPSPSVSVSPSAPPVDTPKPPWPLAVLKALAALWPLYPPALWVLFLVIRRRRYVGSLRRLDFDIKKAQTYFGYLMFNLKFFGLRQEAGETPREFFKRAENRLYAARGEMLVFAEVYYELRYGQLPLTEERARAIAQALQAAELCLLDKYGKTALRFLRYVAGVLR
jgi:transglutaminase-like putative cysteine protease